MLPNVQYRLIILIVLLVTLSAGVGYIVGSMRIPQPALPDGAQAAVAISTEDRLSRGNVEEVDFQLYWEIWDLLKEGYYEQPIDETELFYGSLRGLVSGLNDPYSVFLDPPEASEFNNELSGNFEGIGAEIGIKDDQLTIIAPLSNSPAENAGLLPGDKILAIDEFDTSFMSLNQAVTRIRGEKGTDVVLTVLSAEAPVGDFRDVAVTRDVIHVESVTLEALPNDIFIITISNFNEDTRGLFAKAVTEVLSSGSVEGVILDLRNNPGGFLDTAVKVSGYWTGDKLVVLERFSQGNQNEYQAGLSPTLAAYPTAVLINGGSASASEIVAGALSDYNLATLIGENTFGKGTVQTLETLPDGSSVKYTVAEWLTPLGNSIEGTGIAPDIMVERTAEDYQADNDPQLDAAIAHITAQ